MSVPVQRTFRRGTYKLPELSLIHILIENYKGILEYTGEYIKIQTKNAKLTVYGKKLSIEYYTNEDMKVVGFVKSIEYEA